VKGKVSKTTLDVDGIEIKESFFSKDELRLINLELDEIFSDKNFAVDSRISYTRISKHLKCIPSASMPIFSVNILEKAIDAHGIVKRSIEKKYQDLVATSVEIWQEEKTPKPLFWHTDNRDGMIRCLIYLEGGSKTSGAFKYMLGTHKRDWYCHHKLSADQINDLKHLILIADNKPGTLIAADTFGFHANSPRIHRRRVLMIEFQPRNRSDYARSNIYLKSSDLSPAVLQSISLFQNGNDGLRNHGADYYYYGRADSTASQIHLKIFSMYNLSVKIKSLIALIAARLHIVRSRASSR